MPLHGAEPTSDGGITVPYAADLVKASPTVDGDEIDLDAERALYAHYGVAVSDARSASLLPDEGAGRLRRRSVPGESPQAGTASPERGPEPTA